MVDTRRGPESETGDIIATIAMLHGFAENQNTFFETALHHALNGFEVILIDMKGFGMSSAARGCDWTVFDQHEHLGVMLTQARTDKPLFLMCHSMGCMVA